MNEDQEIDFESPEFMQAVQESRTRVQEQQQEIVDMNDVDTTNDTTATQAETATQADETTTTADTAKSEPNYAEYLANKSGGLFKSEDEFIAALEKVKNYDSLEVRAKELETKVPKFKDEEAQKWFERVQSEEGRKALKEYIAEKDRDYNTMSDVDVLKIALKNENPAWDNKRVDLELRHKYGTNLEKIDISTLDPEEDKDEIKEANAHNREVDKNLELLQMHAFDKRVEMIKRQESISLPELKKAETQNTQAEPSQEEIAERIAKWHKKVEETVPKLSNFKIDIDDKGVEYVWTDDEKEALATEMKDFNIFKWMESNGWTNKDNSWNPDKIAEDVRFLRDKNKVVASIASQVKTETIKATLAKIKNTDGKYTDSDNAPTQFKTLEDAAHAKLKEIRAKRGGVEYEEQD